MKNAQGREAFGVNRHLSLDRGKGEIPSRQRSFLNS